MSFFRVGRTHHTISPSWHLTRGAVLLATLCGVVFVTVHFLNFFRERSERSKNQLKAFGGLGKSQSPPFFCNFSFKKKSGGFFFLMINYTKEKRDKYVFNDYKTMYRAKKARRTHSLVKDVLVHLGQGGTLSFLPRVTLVPQFVQL